MGIRTSPTGEHRVRAIRRLLDEAKVDPAHRIVVTVCCDRATLDGEADTFADKDAAVSATLRLGQVTVVADRVRVRPRPIGRPPLDLTPRAGADRVADTGRGRGGR